MKIVKGDLIAAALRGEVDAIAHGVNCMCRQKNGIAKQMVTTFGTNDPTVFTLESEDKRGQNKLGKVEGVRVKGVLVINAYTQFMYGTDTRKLNYGALAECMGRIATMTQGMQLGLPWIGCGLAGGDKEIVSEIIEFYIPSAIIYELN